MVKKSSDVCNDRKCPFHGNLKTRRKTITGRVISTLARRTAKIGWERRHKLTKYERYETRLTSVHAHNPLCIAAEEKDMVRIAECAPISKTKHFVIVEKLGGEKGSEAEKSGNKKETENKKTEPNQPSKRTIKSKEKKEGSPGNKTDKDKQEG